MFNRRHRFHGYGSLRSVYQNGRNVRGTLINLKFARRGNERSYRVAVVVSRKVSKSAVVRNRIRRRVYEAVRLAADKITPGSDLVFTVFSEQVKDIEVPKLHDIIADLLAKTAK